MKPAVVNAAVAPSTSRIPLVDVNAVPLRVKVVPMVILAVPPVNVPLEKLAALTVVMAFPPWLIVPEYGVVTVILFTEAAISIVQLPKPLPSKLTSSPTPGTDTPPTPPDVADQFAVLLQFADAA